MSNEIGILANASLAQLNNYGWGDGTLRSGRMIAIDPSVETLGWGTLLTRRSLPSEEFSYIVGGLVLAAAVSHATHSTPHYFEDTCHLIPVCYRQSDSQQITQREQRARSIRTISLQTEANVVRVLDFEKPFPAEETSYNPPVPQTPRILKLKR
jgi:hypothetical protein